jgi:Fe-S-cluster-containing dehydrogenase component
MESRRQFLKQGIGALVGAAAVGAAGPDLLYAQEASPDYVMIIDLNKCTGCESCVVACKARNRTAPGHFLTRVDAVETGSYPHPVMHFVPVQCNQCEDPPCVAACPEHATFKLASGIVFTDWNRCKGAGDCVPACPYGARFLDSRYGGKSDKCDFCLDRLERGLPPSCVENCPPGARLFGDRNRPSGAFAEIIKRPDLLPAKPELRMKTRVLYVPVRRG